MRKDASARAGAPALRWLPALAMCAALSAHCSAENSLDSQDAGGDSTAMACTPGASVGCVGPNGCSGYRVCDMEGTELGPCTCGEPPDATASDDAPGPDATAWDDATVADGSSDSLPADAPPDTFSDAASDVDASSDGAAEDGGPGGWGDAGDASEDAPGAGSDASLPDASTDGDSGSGIGSLCTGCPVGQKLAGPASGAPRAGQCVSATDPRYGCAAPGTNPCWLPNAVPTCTPDGHCAIGSCHDGWADCDGVASNGCEADLTSPKTCGSCSNACMAATPACSQGACVASCTFPETNCSGTCADLNSAQTHCGNCTTPCTADVNGTATCSNARCTYQCDPGFDYQSACIPTYALASCAFGTVLCGSACVRTDFDPNNCGSCGHSCASGAACQHGSCVALSSLQIATTTATGSAGSAGLGSDLFVDGPNLLFTDPGGNAVYLKPIAGGPAVTLATGQDTPVRITGDGTYAYWSSYLGGAIVRTLEDGTGSPEVVVAANQPWGLVVDSADVYWADTGTGALMQAPKTGADAGAPMNLGAINVQELTLANGNELYSTRGYGLYETVVPNGASSPVASPQYPAAAAGYCTDQPTIANGAVLCDMTINLSTGSQITGAGWYLPGTSQTFISPNAGIVSRDSVAVGAGCGAVFGNQNQPVVFAVPSMAPFPLGYQNNAYIPYRFARSGTDLFVSIQGGSYGAPHPILSIYVPD